MAEFSLEKAVLDKDIARYVDALLAEWDNVDHASFHLKEWQGLFALAWVVYVFMNSQRGTSQYVGSVALRHLHTLVTAIMQVMDSLDELAELVRE